MFHIGQEVVCVDDAAQLPPYVVKGRVYTIRSILRTPLMGLPAVRLQEIICPTLEVSGSEGYFLARRFRPIIYRKTDISIFTKMLVPETAGA